MNVNNDLILKLERLSKLALSDSEKQQLMTDLDKMIDMFSKISEIDTDGVLPLTHMNDIPNVLRLDTTAINDTIDQHADNAPLLIEGMMAVPKVISQ